MKTYALAMLALALIVSSANAETIQTRGDIDGCPVNITIAEGKHWTETMRIARIIPIKHRPQIAVWTEAPAGEFLATLYVTHRSATQDWRGGDVRRPGSLPCWSHRRGVQYDDGLYMPTKDKPLPDTETAATPKQGFTLNTQIEKTDGPVVFYIEVNQSFDTNDSFPAKDGDVNGQPSAIYRAEVDCSSLPVTADFVLTGHASPDASDGDIHTDTAKLTTGKEIVGAMTVTVSK